MAVERGVREIAQRGARQDYKYKPAASTVGKLQPGWSRFHSSKCHLSNVLAYYDLSFMCSYWGIPCSLTAGPPTHNWLGSRSISASRPSLMLLSLPSPFYLPILLPPSLSSFACSPLSPSLPSSVPLPFWLCFAALWGLATGTLSGCSHKSIIPF